MARPKTTVSVRRLLSAAAVTAGVALSLLGSAPADAAPRSTAPDCSAAYLGPENAGPKTGNYFDLKVAAGERTVQHLVAANPTKSRCRVDLQRAFGKTAINSGDTYVSVGDTCSGVSCWLSDVPHTVTLPPNSRVTVPFTVAPPADAKPGQYLAGVVGQPKVASDGSSNGGGVHVTVRTRVAIGVAVTVAGPLEPSLRIADVAVDMSRAPYASTVAITEVNPGNTWEHPKGTMTVDVDDRKVRISVVSNTILGHNGRATLRAGAGRITGKHHARVVLWYADHTKKAVWDGTVNFPKLAKIEKQGNQIVVKSANTGNAVPLWAWIAIGFGAMMLALVGILLLMLRKKSRNADGGNGSGGDSDEDASSDDPTPVHPVEPAPVG